MRVIVAEERKGWTEGKYGGTGSVRDCGSVTFGMEQGLGSLVHASILKKIRIDSRPLVILLIQNIFLGKVQDFIPLYLF